MRAPRFIMDPRATRCRSPGRERFWPGEQMSARGCLVLSAIGGSEAGAPQCRVGCDPARRRRHMASETRRAPHPADAGLSQAGLPGSAPPAADQHEAGQQRQREAAAGVAVAGRAAAALRVTVAGRPRRPGLVGAGRRAAVAVGGVAVVALLAGADGAVAAAGRRRLVLAGGGAAVAVGGVAVVALLAVLDLAVAALARRRAHADDADVVEVPAAAVEAAVAAE